MAKSWEEIRKEREASMRSTSDSIRRDNQTRQMLSGGFLTANPAPKQKSWEEIRKEREQKNSAPSNSSRVKQTREMMDSGFLVSNPVVLNKSWEEIRKERGYIAIEPEPKFQPLTNINNNYNYGKLAEEENLAWAKYRESQTQEDLQKAQKASTATKIYATNNQVGYGNAITKDFAQYLPQMFNQIGSGAKEAAPSALQGGILFGGTAAIMGQAGPQIAAPEEIITVPVATALGLYQGGKAGYIKGVAEYSYDTMAGAAYKGLLDLGVPNDVALNLSRDEGIVSSLIEAAGAGVDIATIGLRKLFSKGASGATAKVAQSRIKQALKSYGINLVSETIEEAAQEKVSIENEKRAMKAAGLNRMTSDKDDLNRIIEAGKGGFNIALVGGGLNAAGNYATSTIVQKSNSKIIDTEYNTLMEILPEDSPTKQQNEDFKNKMVNVTDEVKKRMIDSAREELGVNDFESETDKLIRERNRISGQNETISSKSNEMVEQTFNREHSSVKSQNKGSVNVNPITNIFNIQNINNPKEVKKNIYEFYKNSIISDSNTSKPIINKSSGMNIEVSRATINQTFQADDKYIKNQDNEIKINAMANVVDLIQNGEFAVVDESDTPSSKVKYAEISGTVNVNGTPYEITMDVRRTDNGKKLFVHSLSTSNQQVINSSVNKKSGVIYNGTDEKVKQQYPKVYDILDRIGKATNTKFKFVETIYDPSGQEAGFANGQHDPSTDSIEIALDTFNPFMVVAKHEITHMLEKENPKLYREYKDYVLSAMKENGIYDREFGRMAALYESRGLNIDKNAIEDELVADATELFLTNENAINNLVAENKTLGQKILDVLRKLVEKIEDILEISGFTEGWLNTEQLREAERLWVNALSGVAEKQVVSSKKQSDVKNSLKDNPYKEKSYHPFKETEKWEEQFERRTKWIREKVDGIKTGKFKGSFGMYATVTPSIKDGKYQITVFDKNDTPMMDAQRNTIDEIAEFLQEDGFVFPEQITKYSLKNIENALVANHDAYKDDKKALKMASEALYELNKIRYSTKDNSGIVTIADGLTREFITEGYVNFNGRKFKSFDELAQIMQIYRDPRFETLRYIYVKEKKKVIHDELLGDYNDSTYTIVGHEAVSSRIPGMSSSIPNLPKRSKVTQAQHEKAFYSGMDKMGDRMKRLKADGYFMLHNHPSGNPNPSSNDRHLTKLFANKIDGFIGHIVINSNKYATITLNSYNGIETSIKDIDQQSIDYHKQPSVYNKILDYNTKDSDGTISMDKIASLAKSMQFVDDKSYLLYLDARGAITGLQMIPNGMPLSEMRSSNSKHFRNFIKNRLVDFGAHSAMLITENRRIFDFGLDLIEQKYIMDSIRVYTNSYSEIDAVHGVWRTQPSNYYEWAGIPEGDIQAKRVFSLKAPVEETKDLIAIHNMDEDKLKGTLELGGFPVPSIAITKAEQGHDDFGDISVIFTKDTIDPQLDRRNRVFGSDVYSKRFPFVNYKLNSKVVDRIKSKISELTNEEYRKEFRISLDNDNIANTLQTYKSNGDFVKGYIDEPLLKLAFLKEKGIAFKPIMKEKTYGRWEVPLLEKIKKYLGNEEAAITFRNLEDTMKLEPDIRRIVNAFYQSKIAEKDLLDMMLYKEPMGFGVMDDLLQQVSRYAREGANKEIDYYKTKEKLEKVTPKKSYRDWLTNLSKGIIEKKGVRNDKDPFTPSGNRRSFEQLNDEYTLDSIIKLMRGDVRGEEGFMYGLGNVRAGMTKEFKSIEDIKQHKDKIVSPEEFREIKEKANQEYYKLSNWFSKYHKYMTGSSDAFDISMFETAKKGRIVPTALKANLKEDGFEVRDIPDFMITSALDFLNSLRDMPAEYFEAKPQRAVGLDEIAAVVAPKTANKELIQQLKDKGITVKSYDAKVEGDRLKKINSVKGVKFSLKDSQGRAITQEQAEYFKDSKVRDKDGNLMVVYHGTNKKFDSFDIEKINSNEIKGDYVGKGIFFANTKATAKKYGFNIITAYLNLKNPLIINNEEDAKKYRDTFSGMYKKGDQELRNMLGGTYDYYQLTKENPGLISAELKRRGYDGLIDNLYGQYAVFNTNQIKSIDNKNPTKSTDIRYSLKDMDRKYLDAVEKGDMETAQKMVNDAAKEAGYSFNSDYQGTSAFNGSAPSTSGYYDNKDEAIEAWKNEDYEGDWSLADTIDRGIDNGDLFNRITERMYKRSNVFERESILTLRKAINGKKEITMYRSVPLNVKEEKFRNGDWITPSIAYANDNAEIHGWGKDYRIIKQNVSTENIWWDGNDINEWGYDDGKTYAYQNTKNNLKLLDPVTYDSDGNIIPLSKRFNKREHDVKYQLRDMTVMGDLAKYTPERLENILDRYGSKSSPNYSQAYVVHMSPDEFLSLTTTNLSRIEIESRKLNLEDLRNETQEIFLKFDIDDKEVTGHEGRHRMVALRDAGVKSVPVVLWQDGEKGKYNKTFLKSLMLSGEEFANNKVPGRVEMKNLVPASRAYEKTLARDFVDAKGETAVRFQLRDNKAAKDVEKLQNTVARLKEQFKLTKGVKLDEKSVRRFAKAILKDYSSKYSSAELETKLYSVYMGMINGDMEYEDAQTIITEAARDIIENASVLNDAMYKQYSNLRNTMRNTAITIDDKYKGDFDAVGGWNDFRKKNFGRMNISNDGMSIDSLYQELSGLYPELFVKDIANPADQLMLISDVLDDFVPIYENPYNRDLNESVEYLALEIFDGMTSVPEAKPTFADKKKAEKQKAVENEKDKSKARIEAIKGKNADDVAWLKYQNKEKLAEVLRKEKAKRDIAVAKVKEQYQGDAYKTWWKNKLKENDIKSHYQEMMAELRANRDEKLENQKTKYKERISGIYEDRKIRQAKDRIRNMTKKLSKMLRNPTQKQHIPKALDKTIAELLSMLDFTTDKQNEDTQLKLRDLRAEFEKLAKVSDEDGLSATADPYIVEALEMLNGKRIADMNLNEIELMRDIVSYFEHMVRTYNKALIGGKWESISGKSSSILNELKTDKPVTESAYGDIQGATNIMKWGMLNPLMYFRRMGSTFTQLYMDIREGFDKKVINTEIAQEYFKELRKNIDKKTMESLTGLKAEVKTFKLDSKETIQLTPAQIMSLYLHNKREQSRGHIYGQGIKAAPIVVKENLTGKKIVKKQFEPVKVTPADVNKIIGTLTIEQKKLADGIGEFFNTTIKQWINEATLQNYGYELAKEDNYFPIKSDKDFLKSDFDINNFNPSLTSAGSLKSVVKGANNPIIIEDIIDVFVSHQDEMATYNAFLLPIENMKKVFNYRTENSSIKQAMNKKFGNQAERYLKKFMNDLQGGIRAEPGVGFLNKLVRWRKRAVLGMNPRVVFQQPTAIVRASALIDPKYLAKGVIQKSDMAEMLKYSPIAKWKSWGYFTLDTGRTMKDIILDTQPILDKQYDFIQKADDVTWTKIWNAVKLEVTDMEPDLKQGSKEYFDAVNYRFSEIVDETQVVDSVLHRSDIMRRTDWSWKMATNFMSEQTKQYNLLLNAFETYKNNPTAENAKKTGRVVTASIANTLTVAFVCAMVDAFVDKEDDEFMKIWFDNAISDPIGMIPFVREFDSIFVFGNRRMEYESILRFGNALKKFGDWVNEWMEGKKHKNPLRLIIKDVVINGAEIPGVSARNAQKYTEAVIRRYMEFTGDDKGFIRDIYEFMFKK